MHVFSEGSIKQFDMVLLFSFGTLDMSILLLNFFPLSFFFHMNYFRREQAKSFRRRRHSVCWSDLGDFASVIALANS